MGIALAALGGLYGFVGGATLLGRLRIAKARPCAIGELPERAMRRIAGRIRAVGEPLRAPLTGRACVGFVAEVLSDFEPGRFRESGAIEFVIEDDSGTAIVEAQRAQLELEPVTTGACGRADATAAEAALFARRRRGKPTRLQDWTFREAVIEAGALVEVIGSGEREPDPTMPLGGAGVYREMPTRMRLVARRGYPLVVRPA
ncbi:MAG TPA: hypothetical protein VGG28_21965 [Kofleriaceae bacterium]